MVARKNDVENLFGILSLQYCGSLYAQGGGGGESF